MPDRCSRLHASPGNSPCKYPPGPRRNWPLGALVGPQGSNEWLSLTPVKSGGTVKELRGWLGGWLIHFFNWLLLERKSGGIFEELYIFHDFFL